MAEKCSSCDHMKKENNILRKSLIDTNKMYVEVINENLELRRQLGDNIRYPISTETISTETIKEN